MKNVTTVKSESRIFVTDYASYNEGSQFKHGHWIDLDQFSDVDELQEYLSNHFKDAGISDPEIMITDFEGFPKKFYSESFDSSLMGELFEYFEIVDNCHEPEAMAAFIEVGYDASDFDEAYAGKFDSDEDFAQDMADQLGSVDENAAWPNNCIDWEYAARELMYDYFEVDGYYFRSV
jgi:antirestriction protein